MELLCLIIAGGAIALLCYCVDVVRNGHPLTIDEVVRLALKRRRNRALTDYRFCASQRLANPAEKKAMSANGEFVKCDLDYFEAPSRIAGFLKYKKHEWIVFAFVSGKRVTRLWWNKGPDETKVWPLLEDHMLERTIELLKPEVIGIFHNHPTPSRTGIPSNADYLTRYLMRISRELANLPSQADLTSANFLHRNFANKGISLLEFICLRGVPHLYYAGFSNDVVPVEAIVAEIGSVNGKGTFKNYSLRKELNRSTLADQVHGS